MAEAFEAVNLLRRARAALRDGLMYTRDSEIAKLYADIDAWLCGTSPLPSLSNPTPAIDYLRYHAEHDTIATLTGKQCDELLALLDGRE